MAKMWRCFREFGPPPENIPEGCYTMEIFHGGYFDKQLDRTKKYKLAKFNKLGGKLYLDELDPKKISWVEFNNIAWELGYREKPISYHFKIPRTTCNEGWISIKNDADAIEMVKLIPLKKKHISIYITGGGKRKKRDAELDDLRPTQVNWFNPLNNVTPAEKEKMFLAANLVASQLNKSYSGNNTSSLAEDIDTDGFDANEGVGTEFDNDVEVVNANSEGSSAISGANQQSQSTFAGLSNIVQNILEGSKFGGSPRRVKHCANRKWTPKRTSSAAVKDKEKTAEAAEGKGANEQPLKKPQEDIKGKKKKQVRQSTVSKQNGKNQRLLGSDFYVDSDYDLQQDDDDDAQFEEYVANPKVVEEFDEMGFRGECSDDGGDSEELVSLCGSETEKDEDGNQLPKRSRKEVNYKPWIRSVDLKNPRFVVGQAFQNSEVLKEVVREFSLKHQLGLWFGKNCREKIEVRCHTSVLHYLDYNKVAKEIAEDFLVDENWSRAGIQNHIQKKYKLDIDVQTISRGKRKAKRMNEGHHIEQYNKLAAYRKELLRSNPGSTVEIKTIMDGDIRRFHKMYICFAACKKG
ncbi:hypothetical protein M0R45_031014 [Rubus argutus]|uniref:PB1-like domain-containing protein n=1 Tax=Rubus argutus TaxID=59490 RepID=A0AAW1WD92_RUBAR